VPEDRWITLRLDGVSWGSMLMRLTASGVLGPGFSDKIEEAMQATCRAIVDEFRGALAYTHSDELTVLIPPSAEPRIHGGSLHAWVSIAASVASGEFNRQLAIMAAEHGSPLEDVIVAHFDCRLGSFKSVEEALALVLWRANDCNVNSASDAIKFSGAPLPVRAYNTIEKLGYLQEHSLLPMRRHQAYGSLVMPGKNASGDFLALVNDGGRGLPCSLVNLVRLGPLLPGQWSDDSDAASVADEDPNNGQALLEGVPLPWAEAGGMLGEESGSGVGAHECWPRQAPRC